MSIDRNAKRSKRFFFVSRASANPCKIVDYFLAFSTCIFFIVDLFRKPGNPDVAVSLAEIEDPYKWQKLSTSGFRLW